LTGGDMIVSGFAPIDITIHPFSTLKNNGYIIIDQYSVQAVFSRSDLTKNSPASIRAVDPEFPLYGEIQSDPSYILEPGTLFAEQAFFDRLGIKKGDEVKLGKAQFRAV
jgi:predicted lysophospholipase L1 biosynthesis ABC-type transport system permease subunit